MLRISFTKEGFLITLYSIIVIFLPILNVYKFVLPVGDVLAILGFFVLYNNRNWIGGNETRAQRTGYGIFVIYCILSIPLSIISGADINEIFSKNLHLVLYMIYGIYLSKYYFRYSEFFNLFLRVVSVLACIELAQFIVYLATGRQLLLLIPSIPLNYSISNYRDYTDMFTRAALSQGYRPSSLFLEPAHYAFYALIALIIVLMKKNKSKYEYIKILIYILSIICSYSSGGVICMAICIIYYFVANGANHKSTAEFIFKTSMIAASIFAAVYVLQHETRLISMISERLMSIGSSTYDTSGNRRVLRGLFVWRELPFLNKIFGTGMGNLLSTIVHENILVLTDRAFSDEMSSLFYLMCSCGILGTCLYYWTIIRKFFFSNQIQKLVIITFLISSFFNNNILQGVSVIYLLMMFTKSHMAYELYENE